MNVADTVWIALRKRNGDLRAIATISARDATFVNHWQWRLGSKGYAKRSEGQSIIYLHRELLGLTPGDGLEADHINRDKLDNRRNNLRSVTQEQNKQNTSSQRGASSKFRGVSWINRQKKPWQAQVYYQGRLVGLGHYALEEDAANVAEAFRLRYLPFSYEEQIA